MVTEAESKMVDKAGIFQIGDSQSVVADVGGSAGATYTSNEQDMINDMRVQLNTTLARLRFHGLIDP